MSFTELSQELAKISTDQPLLELAVGAGWNVTQSARPGYSVRVSVTGKTGQLQFVKVFKTGGTKSLATVSKNELQKFYEKLKEQYQTTKYNNVKDLNEWKIWFGLKKVDFSFHGKTTPVQKRAISCKKCGIYLPIRNMTVDHQAPQKKGGNLAILRVFRHLGYTQSGPVGRKSSSSFKAVGGSQTDRYKLNMRGCLLYSCFQHGQLDYKLADLCMHSIYNLDALCNSCNSGKSNVFKGVRL